MGAEEQVEQRRFLKTLQPDFKLRDRAGSGLEASLADRTVWHGVSQMG